MLKICGAVLSLHPTPSWLAEGQYSLRLIYISRNEAIRNAKLKISSNCRIKQNERVLKKGTSRQKL
jgi:hypothetical protein